jgi:hypothetical protein
MFKISIPQPCHEEWDKMTPGTNGRHCSACAKTVIDFTVMSDDEVKHYFLNKKDEKTCGRFKQSQLHRIVIELPHDILVMEMPFWKKFLAACLIAFSTTLFSCETKINQQPATENIFKTSTGKVKKSNDVSPGYVGAICVRYDSTVTERVMVGGIGLISEPAPDVTIKGDSIFETEKPVQVDSATVNKPADTLLQGLPEVVVKKLPVLDSVKTKNPPQADSTDCNKIFY